MAKQPKLSKWQELSKGAAAGVISAVVAPLTGAIDANVAGDLYSFELNSFYRNPQIHPSPELLVDMYNRGFIDFTLTSTLCRNQGVNFNEVVVSARHRNLGRAWAAYRDYAKERPTVSFIMDLWSRGYWNLDSQEARDAVDKAGGHSQTWQRYVSTLYEIPPVSVLMEGRLRNVLSEDQFTEGLKRQGYGWVHHRNLYRELMKVNPPATDWIHFAVKEALSPDIANAIRLYDEFPQAISQYLGWQGLNWEVNLPITADGVVRNAKIPDLYWASHWQPIAPSQAFAMRHILRQGRLGRYQRAGLDVTVFGMEDVRRWLRINDYPPGVRDNLAALSFNPLRLVDIRQAIAFNWRATNDLAFRAALPQALQARFDSYNRQWAIEQFLDRGVLPDDAETQVDLAIAQVIWAQQAPARMLERGAARRMFVQVLNGYQIGLLPEANTRGLLRELGLSEAAITIYLQSENAKEHISTAKTLLSAARKGMMSGAINEADYRIALEAADIRPQTIEDNLARINSERDFNHVQLTTAKIVSYVGQGILSYQDGKARLDNLGWLESDSVLLLAEATARNLKLQGQAIRAADATRQKRAKELEKALKQAEKNVAVLQAAIRRQTPMSTLQRHLRKGIITQQQFIDRAVRMGYPADVAAAYLKDALLKEPKQPATPSASSGAKSQSPGTAPPTQPATPPEAQAPNETAQASQPPSGIQVERPITGLSGPDTSLPAT